MSPSYKFNMIVERERELLISFIYLCLVSMARVWHADHRRARVSKARKSLTAKERDRTGLNMQQSKQVQQRRRETERDNTE